MWKHILFVTGLLVFTYFFYNTGLGSITFLLAGGYLLYFFIRELKRYRRS